LLALTLALGWAWFRFRDQEGTRGVASAVAPAPSSAPSTLVDPVAPGRPALLEPKGSRPEKEDWVTARPGFQFSLPPSKRGGANPCALPEVDTSAFEPWSRLNKGRFTALRAGAVDASGQFDLVLHLHGDDLARRELVLSGQRFVLYALTLDPSESYAGLFSGSGLFGQVLREIEQGLTKRHGTSARVRKIGLSAWSAGYMGVLAMLVQPEAKDVDAVILIDGLHGQRLALDRPLAPFVDFARRASAGERFMVVTHSSIDSPGFASTTESAHHLLAALGVRPLPVRRNDRFGLELVEFFTQGDFHVRGYAGNDKADHCAQVTLLRDAYTTLGRRWAR
jgi:hypothetical protein